MNSEFVMLELTLSRQLTKHGVVKDSTWLNISLFIAAPMKHFADFLEILWRSLQIFQVLVTNIESWINVSMDVNTTNGMQLRGHVSEI